MCENCSRIFTFEEGMKELRISRPTMLKLLRSGQVAATRIGHMWRISEHAIRDFMKGGE